MKEFVEKKHYIILLALAVLTGCAIVGQAYLFVFIIDSAFLQGSHFSDLLLYLGLLFGVLTIRIFLSYVSKRKGVKLAAEVKRKMRKQLFRHYVSSPMQMSIRNKTGEKVSIVLDAIDEMEGYFSQYIPQMIQTTVIPVCIWLVVFSQHTTSAWILLITAPFIPLFMVIIGLQTKKKSEEKMEQLNAFSGTFLDILQGITTLKLFNQSHQQKTVIEKNSLQFRDGTMEILKVAFASSFMLELISMLSIGIVALELALQLIIFENISFFAAFFILVLVPEFFNLLKDMGSAFHNGKTSLGAAKKVLRELEVTEDKIQWGDKELVKSALPPTLTVDQVTFQYDDAQLALNNISFHIASNRRVAIVGQSGAGKTTLMHLLSGLLKPNYGHILVNGTSLFDYREDEWFRHISYISQNPYIYAGSIAENIAIGREGDVSMDEIAGAAKRAGILPLVQSFKLGFATKIGETGRELSGGEKQRLAIARAFLKKPSLILFDEPTTGLDLYTEQILQQSINILAEHATMITIAHRLHTIRDADVILYLKNGELVGKGNHEELLESVPEYREMISLQRGGRKAT
ncbi:thiol reductant ABC exporter subunit CydD [Salirhabdus salicampi]|uniref:thiol reductant ABC exporter subunit CydD n=1 Tax=Salirhabdus salicampi TaxID=476102 RepID=UPI0020C2DAFA|nr:thiol reductant ABC exporter subunit CydD [Salirhabdus salicampi]MCP8615691.1 thiol reductant ABC exporter subunit CydD [Salirhabdus salicampi]